VTPDLEKLTSQFEIEGGFVSGGPCGSGHIHDTYAVECRVGARPSRTILQRINQNVFRDPAGLMANIAAVSDHLRRKILAAGGDPQREALTLIHTRSGDTFLRTEAGECWRAYAFIEGARTHDTVRDPEHVRAAGRAFGRFQSLLLDFAAARLSEVIPGFHDTRRRFEALRQAAQEDIHGRAKTARQETDFVLRREALTSRLVDLQADGRLPQRVTHNDTKFNNVMIDDQTGEGVCVIDLDTVMPGLSLYDFGDAIRSMANTGAEDETDLSKVNFSLGAFDRYACGYLEVAGGWLEPEELALLPFAAQLMTLECGMRFLTDYLQGDPYFKTGRLAHNLDRTRTQFKLAQEMEAAQEQMAASVHRWARP
jgi:Ser/Thr protein kinase RdoA (MazF antagonist)